MSYTRRREQKASWKKVCGILLGDVYRDQIDQIPHDHQHGAQDQPTPHHTG